MATVATVNAETAIEEAFNANSRMACAPNDPTDQLQPALVLGGIAANQSGLYSLLERLNSFMRLVNLAAEVYGHFFVIPPDNAVNVALAA